MQSNDHFRSSGSPLVRSPHLLANDLQSQLSMLYALTQQSLSSSAPTDLNMESKNKRFKKTMPLPNEPPTQIPMVSATTSRSNSTSDREVVKVVTTAGPQCVDKDFLTHLLARKDVIPARKRRDFIPNEMKDDQYWERRRKNNLAAKRSREKRRLNDIVLETKVVELSNENEMLKAKLNLMLSRLNMKECEMEQLFEEEQRLGHICLKPATNTTAIFGQRSGTSDDEDEGRPLKSVPKKIIASSNMHEDDDEVSSNNDDMANARSQHPLLFNQLTGGVQNTNSVVDLSRSEVKTGNLLSAMPEKSPSPLTPSPSPPNESLLQILANQILKTKQQDPLPSTASSRLLTIASPSESKPTESTLKRALNQMQQEEQQPPPQQQIQQQQLQQNDQEQQKRKWDEAAMTLLSLNKPPQPPVEQQKALQSVCQSVINGLLRKPNPPKATIDYHSHHSAHHQHMQGENFHHHQPTNLNSFAQFKTLMNYFSNTSNNPFNAIPPSQPSPVATPESINTEVQQETTNIQPSQSEHRGDMMPLKLRMKMLNAKI